MRKSERMEERMTYLTPNFIKWLEQLLMSQDASLYILHGLRKLDVLPSNFEVQIHNKKTFRSSPISDTQGFLLIKDMKEDVLSDEFLYVISTQIKINKFTPAGIINFLMLIYRIGSFRSENPYSLIKKICTEIIPNQYYEGVVFEAIKLYNKDYNFNKRLKGTTPTFLEWHNLFFTIQYLDRFDNPIDLLRWILKFKPKEISSIKLFSQLFPDPKVALLEYGIDDYLIRENELLEHLKNNPLESGFYGSLILDEFHKKPDFLGERLASFLVKKEWEHVGKFLFIKIYDGYNKNINSDTKFLFNKQIDEHLKDIIENGKSNFLFKAFEWPNDFFAFAAWLEHAKDLDINMENKSFISALSKVFSDMLNEQKDSKSLVNNDARFSKIWISSPFDKKMLYLNTYLIWSVLECDDDEWENINKEFEKLCYEIKVHLYCGYSSRKLAEDMCTQLLCILLIYPEYNDGKVINTNRLEILMTTFVEIVGRQWVHFTERNDLIWDYSNRKNNLIDNNLLFVITRLKIVSPLYNTTVSILKQAIYKSSTTVWPIDSA